MKKAIELTHPDKILFPRDQITKQQLATYYLLVAPFILPLIKNRPISMLRYPTGIDHEGFFQKHAPENTPYAVKVVEVNYKETEKMNMILCQNTESLLWLVNQNSITQHIWLSKIDKPQFPDRIIFDLDPPSPQHFHLVVEAALILKEKLENEEKLTPFVSTTGSKGLHITVPIRRKYNFDNIREYARHIAHKIIETDPKKFTTEIRRDKRRNRVFIDVARNGFAQTVVAPYSVRASDGAPIATPLFWDELKDKNLRSDSFTIYNIKSRLEQNPWAHMDHFAKSVKWHSFSTLNHKKTD